MKKAFRRSHQQDLGTNLARKTMEKKESKVAASFT